MNFVISRKKYIALQKEFHSSKLLMDEQFVKDMLRMNIGREENNNDLIDDIYKVLSKHERTNWSYDLLKPLTAKYKNGWRGIIPFFISERRRFSEGSIDFEFFLKVKFNLYILTLSEMTIKL